MLAGTLCPPVPAAHRVGAVHISLYIILFSLPYCKKSRRFWGPTLQKRSETAGWFVAGHPSGKLRAPDHAAILFMQPYAPEINPAKPIGKGLRASGFCHETLASRKKGVDRLRETINRLAVEIVIRIAGRNDPERPSAKLRPRSSGNGISSISEGMQPASCRLRDA